MQGFAMTCGQVSTCDVAASVVIACYNCEEFIVEAVHSAICQTGARVEVVIVNDGSTDSSAKLLEQFADRATVIHQANLGVSAARNRGAREAKGPWLKFLDADDYLLPGSIAGQLGFCADLGCRTFPVGRSLRLSSTTGILRHHAQHDLAETRIVELGDLLFDCPLVSAPLYPRDALLDIGGFDVSLRYREDCDLFVRMVLSGWTPRLVATPSFVYRDHSAAGRVSKTAGDTAAMSQRRMFVRWAELLKGSCRKSHQGIRMGLARAAWVAARNIRRSGDIEVSSALFELARDFHADIVPVGSLIYRLCVAAFGEHKAESLLGHVKNGVLGSR